MAKILVVEDDLELAAVIQDILSAERHQVELATDGADGLSRLCHYEYDLVILDWELPKLSGIEIIKQFRAKGGAIPVLMLTGRREIPDREQGLDSGSDDFLTKPFDVRELSARIRALLRRSPQLSSKMLKVQSLELDPESFRVTQNGAELHLQKQEFALLEFFMRNPNRVFSIEALIQRVWNSDDTTPEAVRTSIKRLRKALGDSNDEPMIANIHGVGYRFNHRP